MALIGKVSISEIMKDPFRRLNTESYLGRSRVACDQDIQSAEENLKRAQSRLERSQQAKLDNQLLQQQNNVKEMTS